MLRVLSGVRPAVAGRAQRRDLRRDRPDRAQDLRRAAARQHHRQQALPRLRARRRAARLAQLHVAGHPHLGRLGGQRPRHRRGRTGLSAGQVAQAGRGPGARSRSTASASAPTPGCRPSASARPTAPAWPRERCSVRSVRSRSARSAAAYGAWSAGGDRSAAPCASGAARPCAGAPSEGPRREQQDQRASRPRRSSPESSRPLPRGRTAGRERRRGPAAARCGRGPSRARGRSGWVRSVLGSGVGGAVTVPGATSSPTGPALSP